MNFDDLIKDVVSGTLQKMKKEEYDGDLEVLKEECDRNNIRLEESEDHLVFKKRQILLG